MSENQRLLLDQLRTPHGYVELRPETYESVLSDCEPGDTSTASDFIWRAYNPSGMPNLHNMSTPINLEGISPIAAFERDAESVRPIAKSIAALAFKEYGNDKIGFIDFADALESEEATDSTIRRISGIERQLYDNEVRLVIVDASTDIDNDDKWSNVQRLYNSLETMPVDKFRIALLHTVEYPSLDTTA